MATVYLRGTTYWCAGQLPSGQRWQESTKIKAPNKRAAEVVARDIELRYATDPAHRSRSSLTIAKALATVLEFQRNAGRATKTIAATKYHVEHLLGHLDGRRPLAEVTLGDTTGYLSARLATGAHRHTISKELRTLTQAMRRCAKLGLYRPDRDPSHFIPDELGTVYTPRDRWLPADEYQKLLAALAPNPVPARNLRVPKSKRRRAERQDRRDYVVAWCNLGLRKSELHDVQPGDYDGTRRELRVRGTKTDSADRMVPVNDAAAEVLERRCKLSVPFPNWTDGSCTRDLARACVRAGIAPATPNDFRRTFCSWLCQAGVPERVCAELLGHEDTNMVRAVYGHLDMRSMTDAVRRIVVGGVVPAERPSAP